MSDIVQFPSCLNQNLRNLRIFRIDNYLMNLYFDKIQHSQILLIHSENSDSDKKWLNQ